MSKRQGKKRHQRPRTKPKTPLGRAILERMDTFNIASVSELERISNVPTDFVRDIIRGRDLTKRSRDKNIAQLQRISEVLKLPLLELGGFKEPAHDHETDLGTPQSQMRRALLAKGGDPKECGDPLGTLHQRQLTGYSGIVGAQKTAGYYFAYLYGRVIAAGAPKAAKLNIEGPRGVFAPVSDAELEKLTAIYGHARDALKKAGDVFFNAVMDVAIYETWPECIFIDEEDWETKHRRELIAIARGLCELHRYFHSKKHHQILDIYKNWPQNA